MYKIAKNCIIRSFSLCNLYRFISIKNKGINFGLPRLAIVVWLGILIYIMVKHTAGGNSQQSNREPGAIEK